MLYAIMTIQVRVLLASGLLLAPRVSPNDYDLFANTLERMQLEVLTLKRELEDSLYKHDPLTGAISRINMLPLLREQQKLVKRKNQPCCLAMMDLDNFKEINDHYGHQTGDQVLVETVNYLTKCIRPYDKLFRYGGEEFLLFMQQTDPEQGSEIIERFREEIFQNKIMTEKNIPIQITASFGLTVLDPNGLVEQSIDRADKAMYSAKIAGKNRTHIWTSDMIDGQ